MFFSFLCLSSRLRIWDCGHQQLPDLPSHPGQGPLQIEPRPLVKWSAIALDGDWRVTPVPPVQWHLPLGLTRDPSLRSPAAVSLLAPCWWQRTEYKLVATLIQPGKLSWLKRGKKKSLTSKFSELGYAEFVTDSCESSTAVRSPVRCSSLPSQNLWSETFIEHIIICILIYIIYIIALQNMSTQNCLFQFDSIAWKPWLLSSCIIRKEFQTDSKHLSAPVAPSSSVPRRHYTIYTNSWGFARLQEFSCQTLSNQNPPLVLLFVPVLIATSDTLQ